MTLLDSDSAGTMPGILAIFNNIASGREAEFEEWFQHEHLAERMAVPGFLIGRRHEAVSAWPRYFNVYVTQSIGVLRSAAYLARLDNPTPMTRTVMSEIFKDMIRTACHRTFRLGRMRGTGVVAVRFSERPDENALKAVLATLMRDEAVACGEIWIAADPMEFPVSTEERLRGGDRKIEACLLVETLRMPDAGRVAAALASEFRGAEVGVYQLLCEIAPSMNENKFLVGLIGANIQGSLSPGLFMDAFSAAGIDGFYHLMDVDRLPERRLAKLLDAIRAAGFAGANITYPFKQEILSLLDEVDPEATQTGAVNTVAIGPDGRTTGYNFDRRGWRKSFEESIGPSSASDVKVVLVGAGGAGRAVAFALMDLNVATLVIHDLDRMRANTLCADLVRNYGAHRSRVSTDLEQDIAGALGVVNATQVGMRGFPGNPVPVKALRASHWAADVIYSPIETEFIKTAAAKGARVLNGGGMCVHQAAAAFRLLTGVEPDVVRMQSAFASMLATRERGEG